jgi:hypothetical protein
MNTQMHDRAVLTEWVIDALEHLGGEGTPLEVSKVLWQHHEHDLRSSGDLFFTWQYDMRWAATKLRHDHRLAAASEQKLSRWKLVQTA